MNSQHGELVDTFEEFFRRPYSVDVKELASSESAVGVPSNEPGTATSIPIDYNNLFKFDADFAQEYIDNPDKFTEAAEEVVRTWDLPVDINGFQPRARVYNLPDDEEIGREIGHFRTDAGDHGSLRRLNGQVTKMAQSKPLILEAVFICQRCGTETVVPQGQTDFQDPYQCESCERQGPFKLEPEKSEFADYQRIRLQVPPERSGRGSGNTVDVALKDDLVDQVGVGERVTLSTLLEITEGDDDAPTMEWGAEAHHIEHEDTTFEDLDVEEHLDRIKEIAKGTPFADIVGSIKPSHKGHEEIKLALALQMFGGVRLELPDGDVRRGDPHFLLIGDPGVDKSGLLQWVQRLSPRAVYTSGKSASGVGLTAAATRDQFGQEGWTLEGGAMVEASGGVCCIDEFDKMSPDDRDSMFEAMAQQTISVSKAGINATLPAQTRVLAAANPEMGRFDPYKPIAEQIDLNPALISRFDLIFTMTDQPDEKMDSAIASHINKVAQSAENVSSTGATASEEASPVIDPEVMRAYIAYARQKHNPVLTDEASERIEEEYVNIRTANSNEDEEDSPIPTTPRIIEGIQRLSEASARIRLADEVIVEDVERAVDLVWKFLNDVGIDPETGEFDTDVVETGTSKAQAQRMEEIEQIISELESSSERGAPFEEIRQVAVDEYQIPSEKVVHAIEKLKDKGHIYPTAGDGTEAGDYLRMGY